MQPPGARRELLVALIAQLVAPCGGGAHAAPSSTASSNTRQRDDWARQQAHATGPVTAAHPSAALHSRRATGRHCGPIVERRISTRPMLARGPTNAMNSRPRQLPHVRNPSGRSTTCDRSFTAPPLGRAIQNKDGRRRWDRATEGRPRLGRGRAISLFIVRARRAPSHIRTTQSTTRVTLRDTVATLWAFSQTRRAKSHRKLAHSTMHAPVTRVPPISASAM